MRRFLTIGLIAASATVLVGCTEPSPDPDPTASAPTVVDDPTIVGETVSASPLEADPWVVGARTADLGYILAVNNQDFSIEQFTSTRPESVAERQFTRWVESNAGESPFVYPGPSVLLPIAVTEAPDGLSAEVEFCDASALWLDEAAGEGTDEAAALADGRSAIFTMSKDDDGQILIEDRQGSTTVCDATGAPVGRFDPAPVAPDSVTEEDVRGPLQ